MRSIAACLVTVALTVVCLVSVHATERLHLAPTATLDVAMRGNTLVASPGISGAWAHNPAALADLAGMSNDLPAVNGWRHAASGLVELSGDSDILAVNWGGVKTGKDFGLGAGLIDAFDTTFWGVGFGRSMPSRDIAWGASWINIDPKTRSSSNIISLGVAGNLSSLGVATTSPVRYGVVARDITDEFERMWDLGIATQAGGLDFAIDIADIANAMDRRFRIGATKRVGDANHIQIGAGLDEGNLTFGALYDSGTDWQDGVWRFGGAWQDMDHGDDAILAGAMATWGLND